MFNARELYEESQTLAAQMGDRAWPAWDELEPQQRMNWEALAADQSRKAIEDYEHERAASAPGLFERTEQA